MSRAVLAVMAGLLCALAGMKHAASLKGDAARLGRWVQALMRLKLLLAEGTMSIPEALCAAADGQGSPDETLRSVAERTVVSPMTTLAESYMQCVNGDCPERELLQRMFARLGHGTKESRCLSVEQAAQEMALIARSAADKAEKDAKLWQKLGLIGGISLTILLL